MISLDFQIGSATQNKFISRLTSSNDSIIY